MDIKVVRKLDFSEGLASKFELYTDVSNHSGIGLLHRATKYVESNCSTMTFEEFEQYFALCFKCIDDVKKSKVIRQNTNTTRCLSYADSVLLKLFSVQSAIYHDTLSKATIVGIRAAISTVGRCDTITPFHKPV